MSATTISRTKPVSLLLLCGAINYLYAMFFSGLGVMLPFIGATFGRGSDVQAQLFPATFAGAIFGTLFGGALSERYGRKAVLVASMGMYALGMTLFGSASSFGLALCAAPWIGLGSGALLTTANALGSDLFAGKRAVAMNAIQVAFGAGAAFSPSLVYALLRRGVAWQTLYFALAAGMAVLLLLVSRCGIPRPLEFAPKAERPRLSAIAREPAFARLCLILALYAGAEIGFFSWMPTYFTRQVTDGARWAGLVVTLFWGMMALGRAGTGLLLGRLPHTRLLMLLAVSGAVTSLLALGWPQAGPTLLFVALTGLCFSGIYSVILALVVEAFPTARAAAIGGVSGLGGLGSSLFPWLIGVLASGPLGWRGALGLVPVLALMVAGMAALPGLRNTRDAGG